MPGLDVVSVTFNSSKFLPRLADAINALTDVESITMVDNGSTDDTLEVTRRIAWSAPMTQKSLDNPGFGAAMNVGVAFGSAEYVLLLNPDVDVSREVIMGLLEVLEASDATAAVTCQLTTTSGQPVSSARHFPTRTSIVRRRAREVDHGGAVVQADWLCGALMLWKRSAFEAVGGFGAEYFLYYEDVDICATARRMGMDVKIAGGLTAIHDQGHGAPTSDFLRRVSRESRKKYAHKWLGVSGYLAAVLADCLEYASVRYHRLRKAGS